MSEDRLLRCSLFRSFPFWPWLRSRPDEEVTGEALEQRASGVSAWCHPFGETRGYKMGVKEDSYLEDKESMRFAHHSGESHDDEEVVSSTRRDLAQLAASLRQHLSYQAMVGLEWLPSELLPVTQAQPETLDEIRVDLGECIRCRLHADRTHIVFGEGNPSARIVLVGEGPGREEDRLGRPFVGPAGKLLDQMISAMGWRRQEVYICNVIKCRPPRNRDPLPDEIESCGPFLRRQLRAIGPQAILAVGSFATQFLLSSQQPISRLRNHVYQFEGIPVVPTYHPAYLLRNPLQKRQAWKDVQLLLSLLREGG